MRGLRRRTTTRWSLKTLFVPSDTFEFAVQQTPSFRAFQQMEQTPPRVESAPSLKSPVDQPCVALERSIEALEGGRPVPPCVAALPPQRLLPTGSSTRGGGGEVVLGAKGGMRRGVRLSNHNWVS
eukprot:GHVS01027549.1.p1 GENE.GHVS01027549.1~~GHVS01027549.1.p1  ORF type:complete len:125 (+),score=28.59 GHVS01027549.1:135-509(+)